MQQTRLNSLFNSTGNRLTQFFGNPWRRISLILMGLLFGLFVGEAVATTAGQTALWDVVASAFIVFWVEWMSRIAYRRQNKQNEKSLWIDVLNVFKIGVTYSLFLEAFKLGS